MSDQTNHSKPKAFNFNTLLSLGIAAGMGWGLTALTESSKKLSNISERLVAIESINQSKLDQLTRIELEQNHQRQSLMELQLDMARLKKTPQ